MRNIITEKNEPWRDLVNEGHVWQERLNNTNNTNTILFVIIVGLVATLFLRPSGVASGFDKFVASPIHYFNSDGVSAEYEVFGSGTFKIDDNVNYKKVSKAKGLKKFVAAQLKSLNKTDKLISQFSYGELKANQTFKDPDLVNVKTASDGSIFIGGMVRTETYRTYSLKPWIAVFHKFETGKWEIRELIGRIGINDNKFDQKWITPLIDKTFFNKKNNETGEK